MATRPTAPAWVNITLNIFQLFYFFSSIIVVGLLLLTALLGKIRFDAILPIVITCVIAYGITKRRPWTIIVLTLTAAWIIVNNILHLSPLEISLPIILIQFFAIYFFNRKDVRTIFGAKGFTTIF